MAEMMIAVLRGVVLPLISSRWTRFVDVVSINNQRQLKGNKSKLYIFKDRYYSTWRFKMSHVKLKHFDTFFPFNPSLFGTKQRNWNGTK
jgi:hypothetical protein